MRFCARAPDHGARRGRTRSADVPHWVLPALVAVVVWLAGDLASAQPMGEVIVVPFGEDDLSPAIDSAAVVERQLAIEHLTVIPFHDARDRFVARSRPPQTASSSDLDVLARETHEAIEHVAFGRTAAAQKSVREVISRAERTLETLNRETGLARKILDACLSLVRSSLHAGKREVALEQATSCRRLVPDLAPSEVAHPANVVGVLAEADNMLKRLRIGNLTVQSSPSGRCAVYLNGRHLGATPFRLDRAAAGEYRVQVECGQAPGRVHVVQLGDQPVSLLVDEPFDRAVASDPRLQLRYVSRAEARQLAVTHALQLGRAVEADDVVLLNLASNQLELLRVQVAQQRLVARAVVPWDPDQGVAKTALERALVTLLESRFEGEWSGSDQAPLASVEPSRVAPFLSTPKTSLPIARSPTKSPTQRAISPGTSSSENPRASHSWLRWLGGSGLTLGAASFVVGGFENAKRHERAHRFQSTNVGTADYGHYYGTWSSARTAPYAFVSAGSLLATTGAVTLLLSTPRHTFPWWASATAGVAGLALASWGLSEIVRGAPCYNNRADLRTCVSAQEQLDRGGVVLLAAVPLLAAPLTQLARWATESQSTEIAVDMSPQFRSTRHSFLLRAKVSLF